MEQPDDQVVINAQMLGVLLLNGIALTYFGGTTLSAARGHTGAAKGSRETLMAIRDSLIAAGADPQQSEKLLGLLTYYLYDLNLVEEKAAASSVALSISSGQAKL